MNLKELNALISLLEDPDKEVFNTVKTRLVELGVEIVPNLEEAWVNNFDSIIQSRAEQIIHEIQFKETQENLKQWLENPKKNLLDAWFIVSKYQFNDIDEQFYRHKIFKLSKELKVEVDKHINDLEKVSAFNHIFFRKNGFKGNIKNFHSPENSYINCVLNNNRGNPLSLCMLYIIISEYINFPICGINMPKHFILGFEDESVINSDPIKFYINPFSNGTILNRQDLELFLKKEQLKEESKYFTPCGNEAIIKRLINNLLHSYIFQGKKEKAQEMVTLLRLFKL